MLQADKKTALKLFFQSTQKKAEQKTLNGRDGILSLKISFDCFIYDYITLPKSFNSTFIKFLTNWEKFDFRRNGE